MNTGGREPGSVPAVLRVPGEHRAAAGGVALVVPPAVPPACSSSCPVPWSLLPLCFETAACSARGDVGYAALAQRPCDAELVTVWGQMLRFTRVNRARPRCFGTVTRPRVSMRIFCQVFVVVLTLSIFQWPPQKLFLHTTALITRNLNNFGCHWDRPMLFVQNSGYISLVWTCIHNN